MATSSASIPGTPASRLCRQTRCTRTPGPPHPSSGSEMRLNNWQSKLGALITERMHAPFAWGSQDCVLLGADVKLAVTGEDPAAAWRGTYKDALGAARVLAALGGMEGLAAKFL